MFKKLIFIDFLSATPDPGSCPCCRDAGDAWLYPRGSHEGKPLVPSLFCKARLSRTQRSALTSRQDGFSAPSVGKHQGEYSTAKAAETTKGNKRRAGACPQPPMFPRPLFSLQAGWSSRTLTLFIFFSNTWSSDRLDDP